MQAACLDQRSYVSEPARDRPPLARVLTLAAMSLGYGVVQLDVTIVNTALASIGAAPDAPSWPARMRR